MLVTVKLILIIGYWYEMLFVFSGLWFFYGINLIHTSYLIFVVILCIFYVKMEGINALFYFYN
jgi:hypothetical protein